MRGRWTREVRADLIAQARAEVRAARRSARCRMAALGILLGVTTQSLYRLRSTDATVSRAIGILRALRGLPPQLAAAETAEIRARVAALHDERGSWSAVGEVIETTSERARQIAHGDPPGIEVWSRLYPEVLA